MDGGSLDFRQIFESAPGLFLVLTPELKIAAASDAYLRTTLVTREAVLGRYMFDVFPDNPNTDGSTSEKTVHASLMRVLANRAPDTLPVIKYDIPRPDSEGGGFEARYWSPLNAPILNADGEVQYIFHRVEDVTDLIRLRELEADERRAASELNVRLSRMETEVMLRARELEETARALEHANAALSEARKDADKANRAKSQFLASMSHEIRTPLNGIIGNLELMGQTLLSPEQEELLFDADKAAKSLLVLIGNVLDFSKIEAQKLTIEPTSFNPTTLLDEAVNILQSRARLKGLFITVSIAPDVPELVTSDPFRVRQVLLNLIGNAVKFTDTGGVHVRLTADMQAQAALLRFEVHDSGRGFDEARAALLFEPFTQDNAVIDEIEGTGLGLAISKRIVEVLGGAIATEAVPGEGASFFFTVPAPVVTPAPVLKPVELFGRTILFIAPRDADAPEGFYQYFAERRAHVLRTTPDEAVAIADTLTSTNRNLDVAFILDQADAQVPAKLTAELRNRNAVVVAITGELTPAQRRRRLRSSIGYLVAPPLDARALDRNIVEVVGSGALSRRKMLVASSEKFAPGLSLAGKQILVIEDRLLNQTIIQRQLRKFGVEPTVVDNGTKALAVTDERTFSAILCDCSMPGMDGFEFTRLFRRRETLRRSPRTPIVAMTANAFREDKEKCFAAGMDDFLSKPVTLDRLEATLAHWIAPQSQVFPPAVKSESAPGLAIDLEAFCEILGTSERDIVSQSLAHFEAAMEQSLNEVRTALEDGEGRHIADAAHGAKGEARSVGAAHLGQIYAQIEAFGAGSLDADIAEITRDLEGEVERVRAFIVRFQESRDP